MLVELRGFREASAKLAPGEVVQRLNRFYQRATQAVIDRDGTVDKLIGEEVVAFFGTPYNEHEHERRAVEAALEVIGSMESFWGTELLVSGVVGTGRAFVGNVGEGEMRDYTAVGQLVNVTAALRQHVAAGELLLLSETYAAVAQQFPEALVRTVPLAGTRETVAARVIRAAPPDTARREPPRRSLATILVLDLVGSTETAARLGDAAWRDLLARHYVEVRRLLGAHQGEEIDTAGDGLLATFAAPAEAIGFAHAVCAADRSLGLAARVGIHAGEVERDGAAIRGIAIVIASRIASLAGADEVFVSGTIRDLVAGSGIGFADRGNRSLKGVPEPRQVFESLSVGD